MYLQNAACQIQLLVIDDAYQPIKGSEKSYNKETCSDVFNTKFSKFICIETPTFFFLKH